MLVRAGTGELVSDQIAMGATFPGSLILSQIILDHAEAATPPVPPGVY